MADDVTFQPTVATPPTGTKVATDDVAGSHFQRVKLDVGGDGVSVPVVDADGNVPVIFPSPQDVNIASVGPLLPVQISDGTDTATVNAGGALNVAGEVTVVGTAAITGTVHGNVAHDAVDSGNPVKIGGNARFAGSLPVAVGLNDRVDGLFDGQGRQITKSLYPDGMGGDGWDDGSTIGVSGETADGHAGTRGYVFNGATWDRLRGDTLGLHVSRQATAATATLSNVAGSATSVTLLALNTARKGATINNDSSAILYVKFGTTASTTSFTVKMVAESYYEVPFGYTGRIDGIWASATGSARVTELT